MVRSQDDGDSPQAPHRPDRPHPAVRLAWAAFGVQAVAVGFHQSWHAVGFAEPASEIGHYLLLHFPLHLGVVLLAAAAVWLLARTAAPSLPLALLATGALVQHSGLVADALAVFGDASHTPGAALLVAGGVLALAAPAVRRAQARG